MTMKKKNWLGLLAGLACVQITWSQSTLPIPGAHATLYYFSFLQGKRVGLVANATSRIGETHLLDTFLRAGLHVQKVFSPEHGFRGKADAGEKVNDSLDSKTGVQIVSLYGSHRKPTPQDLQDIDILVFDIQDVGVRFYTYISTLEYVMDAAFEQRIPLIVLDRPNPNGNYVDGPVLQSAFKSFVGMQPVPIVYGMTIGEYGYMLIGERWLTSTRQRKIQLDQTKQNPTPDFLVVPCQNYTHQSSYDLPVAPSPNLREMASIYWYPSTCLFEGTVLSEGRGTDHPFQIFGHPTLPDSLYAFIPKPNLGAKNSKCFYQTCYGWNLHSDAATAQQRVNQRIQLKYLLNAYRLFPGKDSFFLANNFFHKLAGQDRLMKQIKAGWSETRIRESWKPGLRRFMRIRKKYLLYP